MIGKSFGKYRIVDELGRGALGTVYRAIDDSVGREVAIRMLRPELHDSEALKRFMADATTLAKLNRHEHAAVYGVKKSDPDLLILMELVTGESLELLARRPGPLPPERAAYLMSQVLEALSHAHSAGIVHGSLKPSNLMLTDTRYIKIMDFGFSRLLDAARASGRSAPVAEPYLAPEQLMLKPVDARTDLYACGVVLYRLLTDALPFQADSVADLMRKQLHESPTPASAYIPQLPEWCGRVLTKALAKEPADRFQTADEFRTVLMPAPTSSSEVRTDSFAAITLPAARNADSPPPPSLAATPAPSSQPVMPPPAPATPSAQRAPDVAPLQRTKLMTAALALVAIVVVVIAYNVGARLMRPTPSANEAPPAANPVTAAPAATSAPASPGPETAVATPPDATTADRKGIPSTPTPGPSAPPAPAAAMPVATPSTATAATPPSRATPAAAPAFPEMAFEAEAVVADRDKFRERDARVVLSNGTINILEKNNTPIAAVPFETLAGISYSTARHPQWTSPNGPAELLQVEGGAFGIRRSGRNWIALRTRDAVQIIRIKDDDLQRVIAALEARAGRSVDRVAEPKD
jgi:serine/threonine-protein kinase